MKVRALRIFRKKVGLAIKAAREAEGLTLQDLADELGVSYQMVQHYEKGNKAMSIDRYVEICQLLKVIPGKTLNRIVDNVNRKGK